LNTPKGEKKKWGDFQIKTLRVFSRKARSRRKTKLRKVSLVNIWGKSGGAANRLNQEQRIGKNLLKEIKGRPLPQTGKSFSLHAGAKRGGKKGLECCQRCALESKGKETE